MANKVLFSRGFSADYERIAVKDPNTLYFLTDSHQFYLGDVRYGFDSINVSVEGDGDFISDVQYDSASKTLVVRKDGDVDAELEEIRASIEEAVAESVKSVNADNNSAITVTGEKDVTIGLKIAPSTEENNVTLFQDSEGLHAKVEIPDTGLVDVKANDLLLINDDGILSSAEFSLETFDLNGTQYLALKAKKPGQQAQALATLDVSVLVKDKFLKSATIVTVGGAKVLRMIFTVQTAAGHQDEEVVDIPVRDFLDSVYTGGQNINVSDDYVISIDNAPSGGDYDGSDIGTSTVSFGDTIEIPVTTYNNIGLVTGKKSLKFVLPQITGSVGGEGKIVTQMTITDGVIHGESLNVDTTLSDSDSAIPTSKAVFDAIEDVRVRWNTLG